MLHENGFIWARVMVASWLAGFYLVGTAVAGEPVPPHDVLVYKDGDRVQGRVVGRDGPVIVFKSDRFGELRVPVADAVVIAADKPVGVAKPAADATQTKPQGAEVAAVEAKKKAKAAADSAEQERVWRW